MASGDVDTASDVLHPPKTFSREQRSSPQAIAEHESNLLASQLQRQTRFKSLRFMRAALVVCCAAAATILNIGQHTDESVNATLQFLLGLVLLVTTITNYSQTLGFTESVCFTSFASSCSFRITMSAGFAELKFCGPACTDIRIDDRNVCRCHVCVFSFWGFSLPCVVANVSGWGFFSFLKSD